MRPIDADALCEGRVSNDPVVIAAKCAPTLDYAPVVHGEWIDKPTGAYGAWQTWCSACGKRSGIGGIASNQHKPFCPNCGAKMDGYSDE